VFSFDILTIPFSKSIVQQALPVHL